MRKILGTIAITLLGSSAMAGQAVITGGGALHAGPDALYEALHAAGAGTQVETLEATTSWTFVRLPNGARGWVHNSRLAPVGAFVAPEAADNIPTEGSTVLAETKFPEVEVFASVQPPARPVETAVPPQPANAGDVVAAALATTVPTVPETSGDIAIEEVEAYSSVVWPEDGRLNLRAGPGLDFEVVQLMERGDWVSVSAKAGPWVKVEHESGLKGWTHHAFLTH